MYETAVGTDPIVQAREDDVLYAEWAEAICRDPVVPSAEQRAVICDALFPAHRPSATADRVRTVPAAA